MDLKEQSTYVQALLLDDMIDNVGNYENWPKFVRLFMRDPCIMQRKMFRTDRKLRRKILFKLSCFFYINNFDLELLLAYMRVWKCELLEAWFQVFIPLLDKRAVNGQIGDTFTGFSLKEGKEVMVTPGIPCKGLDPCAVSTHFISFIMAQAEVDRRVQKLEEKQNVINLFKLSQICATIESQIDFCKEVSLLQNIYCSSCGDLLKYPKFLNKGYDRIDVLMYTCWRRGCRQRIPVKKDTWFNQCRLSIRKSLFLLYCFSYQFSYPDCIRETSIEDDNDCMDVPLTLKTKLTSTETISDYYSYCREICFLATLAETQGKKIGGKGLTVEIDESKFGKRKYHKGRIVKGSWVFGGVCRETKEIFLVIVEKRDAETLIPIIKSRIAEGSIILSDSWKAYSSIGDCGGGYIHKSVNHSENFVDPKTGVHTQTIESRWNSIKRGMPRGRQKYLYLHLAEYMWRNMRQSESDLFLALIKDINKYYQPKDSNEPEGIDIEALMEKEINEVYPGN